jgi:heptosyltransferase-3
VQSGLDELRSVSRINDAIKGLREGRHMVATIESSWHMRNQLLRDADWAGLAHSLEIRVPFVDVPLIKTLAPMMAMRTHPTKRDLAAVPAIPLPRQVIARQKTGASVPVRDWLTKLSGRPLLSTSLRDWARTLAARWPKLLENDTVKRRKTVLVFRVGQLGDTLVALPAIRAIRNRHPGARLVLLTNWHSGKSWVSSWDILGPTGWFDEVVYYEPGHRTWMHSQRAGAVISDLRAMAPEVAYLLTPPRNRWQNRRDRAFVQKLVGVREVHDAGIHVELPRKPGKSLPRIEPEWRRLLNIVCANDTVALDFASVIPRGDIDQAECALRTFGWNASTRLLALGPGSKMPAKIWPEKNYLDLARRLLDCDQRLRLVVLGGAEDREVGDMICDELGPRVWNLAGRLSIYGSAAVLGHTCGYIGNDSGTMHLAAMAGRPCVALFSARDFPGHWDPYGSHHLVLRREVDCAGCMLEVCDKYQNKCLNLISVDEVFAGAIKTLGIAA